MGRGRWSALDVEEQLLRVAPPPVLARLVGADERMIGVAPPVRRGVSVRGVVAAADMTAVHTQPKVHPLAADPQAVLAAGARRFNVANGVKVSTGIGHHYSADLTAFWFSG